MTTTRNEKTIRNKLCRKGYTLRKGKDELGNIGYMIIDNYFGRIEAGEGYTFNIEDVVKFLDS